jgi:hypothetical protein
MLGLGVFLALFADCISALAFGYLSNFESISISLSHDVLLSNESEETGIAGAERDGIAEPRDALGAAGAVELVDVAGASAGDFG